MKNNLIHFYLKRNLKPSTADRYFRIIEHFVITNPKANRFNHRDVVSYIAEQQQRYKGDTCSTILSAIKKYYDFLLETGRRSDHPCRTFKIRSKKTNIQTQNLFTSSELEELLNRENRYADLEIRNKLILSFLIYQGITTGQLLGLKLADIDLDKGTIYIKSSSKLNARKLELHRTQFRFLEDYINGNRPKLLRLKGVTSTDKLFVGLLGEPLTQDGVKALFKPLKNYFPERVLNPLTVRQSVVTNWVNDRSLPVLTVQERTGMKYPSSLEKYKKIDALESRKLINQYHLLI